ncbi:MAG: hypothetical protein ACRDJ5_11610, partial [Actinomycetota bacterium]
LLVGWRRGAWPRGVPWRRVAGAALVLAALYAVPFVVGGSSIRSGDSPWHMGRTHHLLGGEIVPGGPAPAFDRNGYPWGIHAVMATMVRLVPGSDPADALTALSFTVSGALPLAAACLARRVEPRAGWAGAACMALIGGFGWVEAGHPTFFTSPDAARYGADLMTASPNGLYALLPPALPRELGLSLVGLLGVLATFAARRDRLRPAAVLGGCLGALGLLSVPMGLNAGAWIVAAALAVGRRRLALLVCVALPAILVFALWALPAGIGYLTYGGFVDITPNLGREWPLSTALTSWGLLLPLAAAGLAITITSRSSGARALVAMGAAAAAMLGVAIVRGLLEWQVLGVPHLLHHGRMWPPAHLAASALGGVALYAGFRALRARRPRVAVAGVSALLLLGVVSPVFASAGLTGIIQSSGDGFIYSDEDFQEGSFVMEAARYLDPQDVVAAHGAAHLDVYLFQFSGARIANFDDPRQTTYDVRIRYRDLADRWYRRMRHGGFEADFAAMPAGRAPEDARVLARGAHGGRTFVLIDRN